MHIADVDGLNLWGNALDQKNKGPAIIVNFNNNNLYNLKQKKMKYIEQKKVNNVGQMETKDFQVGTYVVVNYEGAKFPGIIIRINSAECSATVKCLQPCIAQKGWIWPDFDDISDYSLEEISHIEQPSTLCTLSGRIRAYTFDDEILSSDWKF